jgi:predicted ester cyclase
MIERNRALALRWFEEVWNRQLGATVEEVFAPAAVGHMEGVEVVGPAEFHKVRAALLAAFPDLQLTAEDTVAEGNKVVVRWRATGTHLGEGFGIRATRAAITVRGMTCLRIENGRIVEGWDAWNQGALIESLRAASTE